MEVVLSTTGSERLWSGTFSGTYQYTGSVRLGINPVKVNYFNFNVQDSEGANIGHVTGEGSAINISLNNGGDSAIIDEIKDGLRSVALLYEE